MARHEPFHFKSSDELLLKAHELGVELPFQESVDPLFEKIAVGGKSLPNRLAVQPMEGFDAETDGSPSELTFRRYRRYAQGGSGLIWFEATSVVSEGRSNPHQLFIHDKSLDGFKRLVEETRRAAHRTFGTSYDVFLVLQLTHSGRYSRPDGKPKPQVACENSVLDKPFERIHILSDEYLDDLQDIFLQATQMARAAEFDAVDIKACHGYLVHELLFAHQKKNSRYGGNLENRSRFLAELVQRIRETTPELLVAVRLNATDNIPHGFGVPTDGSVDIDLTEPKALTKQLVNLGCSLFNITVGIPYHNPHVGRPFDRPVTGTGKPEEHPLESIIRLLRVTGELQKLLPDAPLVGTGYSWLRQFFPHVGAAVLKRKGASFIGLGRSSFAYPDAPRDLMDKGHIDPQKVCIACSRCTELMRRGHISGCAIRDPEIYGKEYQKLLSKQKDHAEKHRQNR